MSVSMHRFDSVGDGGTHSRSSDQVTLGDELLVGSDYHAARHPQVRCKGSARGEQCTGSEAPGRDRESERVLQPCPPAPHGIELERKIAHVVQSHCVMWSRKLSTNWTRGRKRRICTIDGNDDTEGNA